MTQLLDIVSSRVKAQVFRLLFDGRKQEFYLRELTRRAGLSLATLQQELRGLTRAGLVLARKDGNRVYYSANSGHPIYTDLVAVVRKTDGLKNVLSEALSDKGIQAAFVFGSIARDEHQPNSDVDLMVIGGIPLRKLSQMLSGVSERLGREVNPHLMTMEEFTQRSAKGEHFVKSVLASPTLFVKGSPGELGAMGQ